MRQTEQIEWVQIVDGRPVAFTRCLGTWKSGSVGEAFVDLDGLWWVGDQNVDRPVAWAPMPKGYGSTKEA